MRHLQVQLRPQQAARVLALARDHHAVSPVAVQAASPGASGEPDWTLVFMTLPNREVGAFVDAVGREMEQVQFVLLPVGALPLQAPMQALDSRVQDVSRLSTLELVLSSLQSVGSWTGMLLYSVLAGVIAAYGVIFDVSYLLVAAMLINPMGAPALVSVIGVSVGDPRMFARGGLRFLVSLLLQAGAALVLALAYRLEVSTEMMEQITNLSAWAIVVALAAGAAGAQTQVKSDRDSLVSGTAAGFMVAAALAPPAAVLGLSVPLQRWDYTELMGFLLLLQFLAITAGGWLVLRLFGVEPADPTAGRGSRRWRTGLLAGILLLLTGAVVWQVRQEPRFLKADLSRQALHLTRDAVGSVRGVALVESGARFTRPDLARHAAEGLLIEVAVERTDPAPGEQELTEAVRAAISRAVRERMADVVPFVDVTLLPPAEGPS